MSKFYRFLAPYARKVSQYITEKANPAVPETDPLTSLAAKIITDPQELQKVQPYLAALDKALRTKGVNNIALTGSYGSGKSTILKTFEQYNPQHRYLKISLAAFKSANEGGVKPADPQQLSPDFERAIEISVLQQIIYHVRPSQIPDSRFKRIINVRTGKLVRRSIMLISWILSGIMVSKFDYINRLNPSTWKMNASFDWLALLIISVFLLGFGFLANAIMALFDNSQINKVSIKGEIELGGKTDKSVFNDHLEEILYFFERNNFNVVIIEDLDRFDNTILFTKLREINTLINNSIPIQQEVKFVYATRDELFPDMNDRVKFFEYIIPVIPFINPSNAGEQMTKLITTAKLGNTLSRDFTQDVITFIDDIDMRLLINIFQEYLLYKEQLGDNLIQDRLFAFTVYKNIYPADFSELPKRRGKLFSFFSKREEYIAQLLKSHQEEVNAIDLQIVSIDREQEIPLQELRAPYLIKMVTRIGNFSRLYIKGRSVTLDEATVDENFNSLRIDNNPQCLVYIGGYALSTQIVPVGFSFSSIEAQVSSKYTYAQREQFLVDKANGKIEELKQQTEVLKQEMQKSRMLSIPDIFQRIPIGNYFQDFQDNGLIKSLLLNGYLDENFEDYISLFHEVNITKEDLVFERQIKSGSPTTFSQPLKEIDNLIKRVPERYLQRENSLNFLLMDYLLANEGKYPTLTGNYISVLAQDNERCFSFIAGYIDRKPANLKRFIPVLLEKAQRLWYYLQEKSGVSEERKRGLLGPILQFASPESIMAQYKFDSLQQYLESMADFPAFAIQLKDPGAIPKVMVRSKFKFKGLENQAKKNAMFEFIAREKYYDINLTNIESIVGYYGKGISRQTLYSANFSTVIAVDFPPLIAYIEENFATYITNILLLEENVEETEEAILRLLNNENIAPELKQRFVSRQQACVNDLDKVVEKGTKQLVLQERKVVPSWHNVLKYLQDVEDRTMDDTQRAYLSDTSVSESLSKIPIRSMTGLTEEEQRQLVDLVMFDPDMDNAAYGRLIQAFPRGYSFVNADGLVLEKVKLLVESKIVEYSVASFCFLKQYFPGLQIYLLERNEGPFSVTFKELAVDNEDMNAIMRSEAIQLPTKMQLLKEMDDAMIIDNLSLADVCCRLYANFPFIAIRYEVLRAMIGANKSIEVRVKLLLQHADRLDSREIVELTATLGEEYQKIFEQELVALSGDEQQLQYFNVLKAKGIVTEVKYEKKDKTLAIKRVIETPGGE